MSLSGFDGISPSQWIASNDLALAIGDKLHNLRTTVDDLEEHCPRLWDRFNSTAEQQVWYYRSLSQIYRNRLGGRLAEAVAVQVDWLQAAVYCANPWPNPHTP